MNRATSGSEVAGRLTLTTNAERTAEVILQEFGQSEYPRDEKVKA
jgi:hypothetical protein